MKIQRLRLSAVFLAFAAFHAGPLLAKDVVDNLANANSGQINLQSGGFLDGAQAFETGPEFGTLTSVTVALRHNPPPSGPAGNSEARIILRRSGGDVPESSSNDVVETVGDVTNFASDENFTVLSTTNSLLLPNTRYWIGVRRQDGDFDWHNTADGSITPASTGTLLEPTATRGATPHFSPFAPGSFQKMKVIIDPVPGITVMNNSDNKDTPPDGSLRKAIADAVEGATITFDSSLTNPIILDGTELTIGKSLIIDASDLPGGLVIDGDDSSRVFSVNSGNTVVMRNLTITGGKGEYGGVLGGRLSGGGGGGIFNGGTLTLEKCTVSDNRAGAGGDGSDGGITPPGGLSGGPGFYDGKTGGAGGFGGGIFNDHILTLQQCTIYGNRAGDAGAGGDGVVDPSNTGAGPGELGPGGTGGSGGGIYNSGSLVLQQCTLFDNHAGGGGVGGDGAVGQNGGGAGSGGAGGGIGMNGTLTLEECTVYANRAGHGGPGSGIGGSNGDGGSGGGIGQFGLTYEVDISNSILAGNFVGTGSQGANDGVGPDLASDDQTTESGTNLIGDNTVAGGPSNIFPVGPFVGTSGAPLDPLLGGLADNGGPALTLIPLRGSPAIDPDGGEMTSTFPTDQRGFERIVGEIVDIGAVEAPDYASIDAEAAAQAAAQAAAAAQVAAVAAAQAQAAARAAQQADFSKKLKKLKKKFKNAKRKGQASKAKKLKKQIKKLTKQMRAL